MNFVSEEIEKYSTIHSESESELLKKLYRETHLNVLNPRMISGPLQGRILSFISKIINPNKILEIGTFTGYSTLCLAEGLKKNGTIQTIEKNDELIEIQNKYSNKLSKRFNVKISLMPFNIIDFMTDEVKKINPPMYDLTNRIWINKEPGERWNYLIVKLDTGKVVLWDRDKYLCEGKICTCG